MLVSVEGLLERFDDDAELVVEGVACGKKHNSTTCKELEKQTFGEISAFAICPLAGDVAAITRPDESRDRLDNVPES